MKKIIVLVLSLFLVSMVFAIEINKNNPEKAMLTTKITGKVFDKITGEVLAGVKVSITNSDKFVYTDFEGNFIISDVKPGNTEITASFISYKEKKEIINLDLVSNNNIELKIENLSE